MGHPPSLWSKGNHPLGGAWWGGQAARCGALQLCGWSEALGSLYCALKLHLQGLNQDSQRVTEAPRDQ